ncbi:MAG: DNA-directed RNA polymerase subunit alpha C-terminal domain-containing protein [Hydrogenophaga sp.]|nr:DNA-directed RNA polymerase subunit alpha C-terminal domain-containing protein [Hydrogenophaga sp.]MDZ4358886.1 DNA-directed RNA polymerase subunit alpha C-terminal domain-containing protein [Variovorax sp.]
MNLHWPVAAFEVTDSGVKDEKTSYAFDTSAIEHLEYPRDLRFARINDFKQKLAEMIKATHQRATTDSTYTTFLKHFGEFKVAKLDKKEVSGQEFILDELRALRSAIRRIEVSQFPKEMWYAKERGVRLPSDIVGMDITPTTAIESLGLSEIALKALMSAGITTVGEVLGMSENDILKLPSAGRRTLNDIKEVLAVRGLTLAQRSSY